MYFTGFERRAPFQRAARAKRRSSNLWRLVNFVPQLPPVFYSGYAIVLHVWSLGRARVRMARSHKYGCISMLRYWFSLRYSSLRTLFLLADDLRRQPTPAHPFPVSYVLLVCLSLRGISVIARAVSLSCRVSILYIPAEHVPEPLRLPVPFPGPPHAPLQRPAHRRGASPSPVPV